MKKDKMIPINEEYFEYHSLKEDVKIILSIVGEYEKSWNELMAYERLKKWIGDVE